MGFRFRMSISNMLESGALCNADFVEAPGNHAIESLTLNAGLN